MYTHNINKTVCFCEINKIYRVCFQPSQSLLVITLKKKKTYITNKKMLQTFSKLFIKKNEMKYNQFVITYTTVSAIKIVQFCMLFCEKGEKNGLGSDSGR